MSDPIDLAEFVKRGQQMAQAKYAKWGHRWLWLAVALAAAAIILTDWRLSGLALLAAFVGGAHFYAAGQATKPDIQKRLAEIYRQKIAEDPDWRPKLDPR